MLDNLTNQQKIILDDYMAVTATQDIQVAVDSLSRHGWDLSAAVNDALGDVVNNGNTSAERPIPQPSSSRSSGALQQYTLFSLLFLPLTVGFKFGFSVLWGLFTFLSRLTGIKLPARRVLQSTAAAQFIQDFKKQYIHHGSNSKDTSSSSSTVSHPDFFSGSYSQALDSAKQNLRYLLVYLHAAEHDDVPNFCKAVLLDPKFVAFLREKNILLWAADIRDSEPYRVSNVLGACAFPFLALLAPQNTSKLSVIYRVQGLQPVDVIMETFKRVMDRFDTKIAHIRHEMQERVMARQIREQQDEAYEQSLRADREKAAKAQLEQQRLEEERQKLEQEQREAEMKKSARATRREELKRRLASEPEAEKGVTTTLSFRFSSGERLVRRFIKTDTIQAVYDFVETTDITPVESDFVLIGTFPRRTFLDKTETLVACNLVPNASLVVELVDEDEQLE